MMAACAHHDPASTNTLELRVAIDRDAQADFAGRVHMAWARTLHVDRVDAAAAGLRA